MSKHSEQGSCPINSPNIVSTLFDKFPLLVTEFFADFAFLKSCESISLSINGSCAQSGALSSSLIWDPYSSRTRRSMLFKSASILFSCWYGLIFFFDYNQRFSGKVNDHVKYTILVKSIWSWLKIYDHLRQVYDHLLKI